METKETSNRKDIVENIAWWAFIGGMFLLPIFALPTPSFPLFYAKTFIATLIATIGVVSLSWGAYKKKKITFFAHPLTYASFGLLVASLLSSFFSGSFANSFAGNGFEIGTTLFLFVAVVLYMVSLRVIHLPKRAFSFVCAFLAVSVLLSLFQIIRLFIGESSTFGGLFNQVASSIIGKWNDLAVFSLASALIGVIGLSHNDLPKRIRTLFWVAFVLSLVVASVVNFGLTWYIFGVTILLFVIHRFVTKKSLGDKKVRLLSPALIIGLVFVAINVIPFIPATEQGATGPVKTFVTVGTKLTQYFRANSLEARPSWSGTFDIAAVTIKENPVFGVGPNRFQTMWALNKSIDINNTIFWNTDFAYGIGYIPTVLVTTGILGFVSWLVFLAFFVYAGLRSLFTRYEGIRGFLVSTSWWTAFLLWILTICYVPGPVTFVFAFVFTGLFVALSSQHSFEEISLSDRPRAGFATLVGLGVSSLAIVLCLVFLGTRTVAASQFAGAVTEFGKTNELDKAEVSLKNIVAVAPLDVYFQSLVDVMLGRLNKIVGDTAKNPEESKVAFQAALSDAILSGQKAIEADPQNFRNHLALGRVFEAIVPLKIDGAYDAAAKAYGEAILKAPTQPLTYLTLARLQAQSGKMDEARKSIAEAIKLKGNYTEALFFLAQIEIQEGNTKQAITTLESTATLVPNDVGTLFQLGFLKYDTKDYKGAAAVLERAIMIAPAYANARYYLGLAYDKLGNKEAALLQFEEIAKTNPDNAEIKGILANLKAGRKALENAPVEVVKSDTRKKPPVSEN